MKWTGMALVLLPALAAAGEVRMDFTVTDYAGAPVVGADIECYTKEKPLPYGKAGSRRVSCQTDREGAAHVGVEVWDGTADCYFRCDGYYPEELRKIRFKSHFDQRTEDTVVTETEKPVAVRMRKRIKPVPMISHYLSKCVKRFPPKGDRHGFDLAKADWLAPDGIGEKADFYVRRTWTENDREIVATGALEFPDPGCGAYVAKRFESKAFPFDYHADTSRTFLRSVPFSYRMDRTTKECRTDMMIANDEYLVVRSRVELDADGRIVRSNYSAIEGPVFVAKYFSLGRWYFNPAVNDTNLEYERNR